MIVQLGIEYLIWHFWTVPIGILAAWRNVLAFNLDYFSVLELSRTLFAPWRRYEWSYGKGFNPSAWFEALASNTMSRVIGAAVRTLVVTAGLAVEFLLLLSGPPVVAFWILLPVATFASIFYGLIALF